MSIQKYSESFTMIPCFKIKILSTCLKLAKMLMAKKKMSFFTKMLIQSLAVGSSVCSYNSFFNYYPAMPQVQNLPAVSKDFAAFIQTTDLWHVCFHLWLLPLDNYTIYGVLISYLIHKCWIVHLKKHVNTSYCTWQVQCFLTQVIARVAHFMLQCNLTTYQTRKKEKRKEGGKKEKKKRKSKEYRKQRLSKTFFSVWNILDNILKCQKESATSSWIT